MEVSLVTAWCFSLSPLKMAKHCFRARFRDAIQRAHKDCKERTCRLWNDHFIYSTPALFILENTYKNGVLSVGMIFTDKTLTVVLTALLLEIFIFVFQNIDESTMLASESCFTGDFSDFVLLRLDTRTDLLILLGLALFRRLISSFLIS